MWVKYGCGFGSQSSSLSAASAGGVGGDWGHVLDSSDLDAVTGDGSKGRLCAWAWGLVAVASSGSEFDMDGSDVELLESVDDINSGLHGSIGRGLITISLDLHSSCDSR